MFFKDACKVNVIFCSQKCIFLWIYPYTYVLNVILNGYYLHKLSYNFFGLANNCPPLLSHSNKLLKLNIPTQRIKHLALATKFCNIPDNTNQKHKICKENSIDPIRTGCFMYHSRCVILLKTAGCQTYSPPKKTWNGRKLSYFSFVSEQKNNLWRLELDHLGLNFT